jgi:hypothetical protein
LAVKAAAAAAAAAKAACYCTVVAVVVGTCIGTRFNRFTYSAFHGSLMYSLWLTDSFRPLSIVCKQS